MMAAPNIQLVRKLRDGGMGSVWVGEHQALKTFVAVKFMLLDVGKKKDASTRFQREASAAAQIKSPHVVQVFDHGLNERGHAYIVMELLDGEDLGTRLASRTRLPLVDVATIVSQSAKALGKAHGNGIIHRDIKPDNIFLTDVDGDIFVKVLDFGIAKSEDEVSMTMTSTGVMMGTPNYMAPEQMTNAKDAVAASDLWSLAIVAYQALTGVLPFVGETIAGIAIAIERGKFKPPSELVPGTPTAVDAWFERCFKREPKDRFANAREMADELMAIVNPNARRPMVSELGSAVTSQASLVDSARSPGRLPTQMGATLDGSVPMRKRGVAVWVLGALGVAALVVGAYVFTRAPKDGAETKAPDVAAHPETAASEQASARTSTPAPSTSVASVEPSAAVTAETSASADSATTPAATTGPTAGVPSTVGTPNRPTGKPVGTGTKPAGKWPPKPPTVKDRGF